MKQHSVKKWVLVVAGLLGASPALCPNDPPVEGKKTEAPGATAAGAAPRRVMVVVATFIFVRRGILRGGAGGRRRSHAPERTTCSAVDIEDLGRSPRACTAAARCGHTCSAARRFVAARGVSRPAVRESSTFGDGLSGLTGLSGAFLSPAQKAKVALRRLQAQMNSSRAFTLTLNDGTTFDLVGGAIRQLVTDALSVRVAELTPSRIEESLLARQLTLDAILSASGIVFSGQEDKIHQSNSLVAAVLREVEKLLPRA